jgi:hypothetical protein
MCKHGFPIFLPRFVMNNIYPQMVIIMNEILPSMKASKKGSW